MNPSPEVDDFERLYRHTATRLMAYCLRHAGPQAAEDAVAETFAVAWRRRAQLPDDPFPWLVVTARNVMAAQRRKGFRQHDVAERVAPLSELVTPSPEVASDRRAEIIRLLSQLNPDDREALLLVAWDGLSTRDAARVLGCTPGALRVRLHRARARLRNHHTDELATTH